MKIKIRKDTLVIFFIFIAIAMLFVYTSFQWNNKAYNNEVIYKQYENKSNKIRLLYPENYEFTEYPAGILFKNSSNKTSVENFNLIIENLSSTPMSLEQYTDLSFKNLKNLITNFNLIDAKKTILNKEKSYEVVYTAKQWIYNLKIKQIWTILDNKAYILTYSAPINQFDNNIGIFNKVFDSFEIWDNISNENW